jgi:hypothetical protein
VSGQTLIQLSQARIEESLRRPEVREAGQAFLQRFEREDAIRDPLELAAQIHQRDEIHAVRLSPLDEQRALSTRALEDKICGETFGHFGAFLKKSWRSNDILWGRLDGICRLTETLLLHTHFGERRPDSSSPPAPLRVDRLLAALGEPGRRRRFLGRLFPHLHARIRADRMRTSSSDDDLLDRLLSKLESTSGTGPNDRAELTQTLIETAQIDALCEDLPKVIADAAEEQLDWGMRKVGPKSLQRARFRAESWQFEPTATFVSPSVLSLSTGELARRSVRNMNAPELARYFRDSYGVGRESAFGAMPRTVLADHAARLVSLTERALVGGGDRIGSTLRENGLYRLVIRAPIRVISGLTGFLRRSPHYARGVVVGSIAYALLAVVANVLWFVPLHQQGDSLERTIALWAFVLVPAACFAVAWILWRPGPLKRLFIVVAVAAALFGLSRVGRQIGGVACEVSTAFCAR